QQPMLQAPGTPALMAQVPSQPAQPSVYPMPHVSPQGTVPSGPAPMMMTQPLMAQVPAQPAQPYVNPMAPQVSPQGTVPSGPAPMTMPMTQPADQPAGDGAKPPEEAPLGPTPLAKVGILQGLVFGENAESSKLKLSGWMDFDYTYRSTGSGINNV